LGEASHCGTQIRWMNNKTCLSELYSESILLFSVQHVLAVIISHNQALMKVREKRTLTYNTLLSNRQRPELYSVYEGFHWLNIVRSNNHEFYVSVLLSCVFSSAWLNIAETPYNTVLSKCSCDWRLCSYIYQQQLCAMYSTKEAHVSGNLLDTHNDPISKTASLQITND